MKPSKLLFRNAGAILLGIVRHGVVRGCCASHVRRFTAVGIDVLNYSYLD